MKPKIFQKIQDDMECEIPIKIEITYGAIAVDSDFLNLLNRELSDGRGTFHTDEYCNEKPCSCESTESLIIKLKHDEATNINELKRLEEGLDYFNRKFRDVFWKSYVSLKDKQNSELCAWNIGSSKYNELARSEIDLLIDTNCTKTTMRKCSSNGKTCEYLRRISE